MPHMSPMSWLLLMLLFWSMLFTLTTIFWWTYSPFITLPAEALAQPIRPTLKWS